MAVVPGRDKEDWDGEDEMMFGITPGNLLPQYSLKLNSRRITISA